jgi:hypothetical protein
VLFTVALNVSDQTDGFARGEQCAYLVWRVTKIWSALVTFASDAELSARDLFRSAINLKKTKALLKAR